MKTLRPLAVLCLIIALVSGCSEKPSEMFTRCVPDAGEQLDTPGSVQVARALISAAENSTLQWEKQLGYLEYNVEGNSSENRGYTGGIVGFTSRTHDMLLLVKAYAKLRPSAELVKFVPALEKVDGTSSREGLGQPFEKAWAASADDPEFRRLQLDTADQMYLRPAIVQATQDRVGRLGQFMYYDALVVHGPGTTKNEFSGIRQVALRMAKPPSQGGNEEAWLTAFADARRAAMKREEGHQDTSRVDNAQVRWLKAGNLALALPLDFEIYGDRFHLDACRS